MVHTTRRSLLSRAGVATGVLGIAGCIDAGSTTEYWLSSYPIDVPAEEYLQTDPVKISANYRVDYPTAYKRSHLERLYTTGSLRTTEWPLNRRFQWGSTTRSSPRFFRHDGTYYRIRVTDRDELVRSRWALALDRTTTDPGPAATIVSAPVQSLSATDSEILSTALDAIPSPDSRSDRDPSGGQTIRYHDGLQPDASALVPSPPFEYVEHEGEQFSVGCRQETDTEVTRTFSADPVAQSEQVYREHVRRTVPDARFSDVSLGTGAESVLDAVSDPKEGATYTESSSLSGGLREVLEHLGIASHLDSAATAGTYTEFAYAVVESDGNWYELEFAVDRS